MMVTLNVTTYKGKVSKLTCGQTSIFHHVTPLQEPLLGKMALHILGAGLCAEFRQFWKWLSKSLPR